VWSYDPFLKLKFCIIAALSVFSPNLSFKIWLYFFLFALQTPNFSLLLSMCFLFSCQYTHSGVLVFLTVCSTLLHDLGCTLSKDVLQRPLGLGCRWKDCLGLPFSVQGLAGTTWTWDTIGEMLECLSCSFRREHVFLEAFCEKS